jgi:hypothetical protein
MAPIFSNKEIKKLTQEIIKPLLHARYAATVHLSLLLARDDAASVDRCSAPIHVCAFNLNQCIST